MKFAVVVLLAVLGAAIAEKSYEGYKVYKLTTSCPSQLNLINKLDGTAGFDFWSRTRRLRSPITIMVTPERQDQFVALLKAQKIKYEVIIEDAQIVFDAERMRQIDGASPYISFTDYHRHAVINAYLDDLAARFPGKVTVQSMGTSYEGRDLKVIKISTNPSANNPILFIDAGIHAREWIAPSMALFVIQELVEKTANDALLSGLDWYIIPVLNPDGYEFSHTDDRMWRKTRSITSRPSCPGVDGNRNFGVGWGGGGTSSEPCSDVFRGTAAFTENETIALRNFLDTYKLRIKLYLTIHSYGEYLLYPWSYTTTLPDNWQALDALAHTADNAQFAAGGNHYTIGQSTVLFGETAGSSDDWAMGGAMIPMAYTIELPGGGTSGFNMPPSQIQTTVSTFFPAFLEFGKYVQANNK